jgi:hypothetical protein
MRAAPTQTYGGDLSRCLRIFKKWTDISCLNARDWAPPCSIGCQKSRHRTKPIPMRRWFALLAPGSISSTGKPANCSERTNAAVPARTQPRLKFTFVLSHRNGLRRSESFIPGAAVSNA